MNFKLILCLALVMGNYCHAAITYPKPPDDGKQAVTKILNQDKFLKILKVSHLEDLTIAEPFGCYGVGLTNLLSEQWLSGAKIWAWRYFLMRGTNLIAAMDLNANEKREPLKFNDLQFSPSNNLGLDPTLKALQQAEKLPQTNSQDYEFRFLENTPISFNAVWLHGKTNDIIIPVPPTFGRWNAYQPYSESEMIKLLKPEAEKKLEELSKQPPGTVD